MYNQVFNKFSQHEDLWQNLCRTYPRYIACCGENLFWCTGFPLEKPQPWSLDDIAGNWYGTIAMRVRDVLIVTKEWTDFPYLTAGPAAKIAHELPMLQVTDFVVPAWLSSSSRVKHHDARPVTNGLQRKKMSNHRVIHQTTPDFPESKTPPDLENPPVLDPNWKGKELLHPRPFPQAKLDNTPNSAGKPTTAPRKHFDGLVKKPLTKPQKQYRTPSRSPTPTGKVKRLVKTRKSSSSSTCSLCYSSESEETDDEQLLQRIKNWPKKRREEFLNFWNQDAKPKTKKRRSRPAPTTKEQAKKPAKEEAPGKPSAIPTPKRRGSNHSQPMESPGEAGSGQERDSNEDLSGSDSVFEEPNPDDLEMEDEPVLDDAAAPTDPDPMDDTAPNEQDPPVRDARVVLSRCDKAKGTEV
jgi:hypothetical protein